MAEGVVKAWLEDRGFGFITEPGGDDVFVHAKQLPRGTQQLVPGERVTFSKRATERGVQACDVIVGQRDGAARQQPALDVLTPEVFMAEVDTAVRAADWEGALLQMARGHGWVS
jgi:cold shock CspA family protein